MEYEGTNRRPRLVRMEDHDRVSQASSVVTISSFPVRKDSDDKVQTFGKGCRAARRDPNCPVVIRGWLNKKDSSGLKLWKRRWFVLSNYCLFYYKDSREESVLGSIPLPSYNILFCTPRECKNRKNTFKVVHQGMRSYFFSADTQEDMLGWVRALSQSACMESDGSINRRCSSYQDFTQIGGSSESVELLHSPSLRDGLSHNAGHHHRSQKDPSQLTGGRMGTPHTDHRGRRSGRQSPSPKTPSSPEFSRKKAYVPNQDEDSLPFLSGPHTPPKPGEFMGTGSLTPRGHLGSRPHTPVGRVDIRPQGDLSMMPQCYAPVSPKLEYKSTPQTPVTERWQNISQPIPTYSSLHHIPTGRRTLSKSYSTGAHTDLLPPLPPSKGPHASHHPHHHHHHHHRSHMSVCLLPPAMPPKPDVFQEREPPPVLSLESDADAVLTRLCGCDKLLQSLSIELAQLQVDKDSVQCALEMTRLQLEDWRSQGLRGQEGAMTQKALLQEELVTIRARMCDVSLEMERVWCQYERMESELAVFRSHLQHLCNFGMPQEQSQAQRELWMMEDILAGLKVNRDHFRVLLGLQRHQVPNSVFLKTPPQPGSPGSPTERLQSGHRLEVEPEPPARPPLPQGLQGTNERREQEHMWAEPKYEHIPVDPLHRRGQSQPDLHDERTHKDMSEYTDSHSSSRWTTPDSAFKVRMSEEEQLERMKRNQERLANRRTAPLPSPPGHTQCLSSEPTEEVPFPLRVTRVVTAVLPSTLIARRVSVEDPPPELVNTLPEQIPQEMQQRLSDQSRNLLHKMPRRLPLETHDANSSWPQAEMVQEASAQRLAKVLQDLASERHEQNPHGPGRAQQHVQNTARSYREDPDTEPEPTPLRAPRGRARAASGDGAGMSDSRVRGEDEEHVSSRGIEPGDSEEKAEGRTSLLLTSDLDPDLCLTPEQREAKLRRVERIRERVIRSAVRESAVAPCNGPMRWERRERRDLHSVPTSQTSDAARKRRETSDSGRHDNCGGCCDCDRGVLHVSETEEPGAQRRTSPDERDYGDRHEAGCNSHLVNKTQHKEQSSRKGIMKRKKKASPSTNHHSSKPVYQRDADHRFNMTDEVEREGDQEDVSANEGQASSSSSNLRTEWFLSTGQWQGFMPLQNHGTEPLFDEGTSIVDPPLPCCDTGMDSNEDCSSVSQSLEKIMDNHSLFYKIACDINLSDNDITMTDGDSNVQASTNQKEVAMELTNEVLRAEEVIYSVVRATEQHGESPGCHGTSATNCNGNIITANKQPESPSTDKDTPPTVSPEEKGRASVKPVHELCIYEEIQDNHGLFKPKGEDASQENQLKVEEEDSSPSPVGLDPVVSEQNNDHLTGETRNVEMEGDEPVKAIADQGVSVEVKGIGRDLDGKKEDAKLHEGLRSNTVPKCKTNSKYEGGMAHRSASFGTGRVTVLHTSL
ncbi:uncharacterized protein si:ch211-234p6.5 isoform X2 [Osmerus eperlanus]|uniref:uncharacterized protein si:ch211-234p6.5 isoform X2 n=1 Tax=Osmerus eperlanus TaxID=29151 RepID=UPI002E15084C